MRVNGYRERNRRVRVKEMERKRLPKGEKRKSRIGKKSAILKPFAYTDANDAIEWCMR